jgi:hypothetical protein
LPQRSGKWHGTKGALNRFLSRPLPVAIAPVVILEA